MKRACSVHPRSSRLGILLAVGVVSLLRPCTVEAQHLNHRLQSTLDSLRAEPGFPGATAAYVLADGTSGIVATGKADVEAGIPMTERSRMLAGSIGKTFVAAAVVALANEGVLDLDARISRWLGDRAWYPRLPNHDRITVRHLLTHTSGLPDHVYTEAFAEALSTRWRNPGNPFTPEELIAFVLDRPPLFAPGEGWAYSDTGYLLLGLIIEAATGRTYELEIRERFLEPLDLSRTEAADRRDLPGLAAGYTAQDNPLGLPHKTTAPSGEMRWHPGIEGAGGGLVSNALDLALWGKALFEGRAMEGPYLTELLSSVPVSDASPDVHYGAGVAIHRRTPFGPSYGHAGWIPGYTSSLRYYPDYGVAVAFQVNTDIGFIDGATRAMEEMEERLADVVMPAEATAAQREHREKP